MVKVQEETKFIKHTGREFDGFYINSYLKDNIDNYLIKAVQNKFDGVVAVTGIEGAGKTTLACTIAKYVDSSFPGEPIEGSTRRKCDRIVFTADQIMKAIDTAHIGQAIVIDEAILSLSSSDFSTEIQRILIKKFVTIRKKRLYIFVVIPSIFMLRKYFAIFRTRCLIHASVEEGINRGYFKFFSYDRKRKLYLRGLKEFDQACVKPDFIGDFTDTDGFFFCPTEYDDKKEVAIVSLTEQPEKEKKGLNQRRKIIAQQLYNVFYKTYLQQTIKNGTWSYRLHTQWLNENFELNVDENKVSYGCRDARDRKFKIVLHQKMDDLDLD